jgi:lipopolysaccharide transport system ATP-binding protein
LTSYAISVRNLSKSFRLYHPERPQTFQESFLRGFRRRKPRDLFWALREISVDIGVGRVSGVIGRNGSGKSTLLRLIAGVGRPDSGTIKAVGRVGGLLDLGAGFHPELTGRENALVGTLIGGLTRRQALDRFDSIVGFAELEDFIDNPLRTYSTGMWMRLAFAVAIHIEADVVLIDEFLSVGDEVFQKKCLERIESIKRQGSTVVVVSHDVHRVRELCDDVLWLRDGRLIAHGAAEKIVSDYILEAEGGGSVETAPGNVTKND